MVEELYALLSSARFEVAVACCGGIIAATNFKVSSIAYHGAQESKVGEEEA